MRTLAVLAAAPGVRDVARPKQLPQQAINGYGEGGWARVRAASRTCGVARRAPSAGCSTTNGRAGVESARLEGAVLLAGHVFEAVADQVHDAGLDRRGRERRLDRLGEPLEPVNAADQDVLTGSCNASMTSTHARPRSPPRTNGSPQASPTCPSRDDGSDANTTRTPSNARTSRAPSTPESTSSTPRSHTATGSQASSATQRRSAANGTGSSTRSPSRRENTMRRATSSPTGRSAPRVLGHATL